MRENAWWESGSPATLNAKNSVAEWSWESHFPVASQRQEGVGVGGWENCEVSVVGELQQCPGSMNASQSLSQRLVTQMQHKAISMAPTGHEKH